MRSNSVSRHGVSGHEVSRYGTGGGGAGGAGTGGAGAGWNGPGGDGAGLHDKSPSWQSRSWLARLSLALVAAGVTVLVVFAGLRSIAMLAVGVISAVISLAAAYLFLARRGVRRWLALAVLILSPVAVIVIFAFKGLLWVALVSAAAWVLAVVAARGALAPARADWVMPETPVAKPSEHPFLIMNPRAGGGKVARFDLIRRAEERGAEVFLMTGPQTVNVVEVARAAVARGADLLGVAGGDGTQALVAAVAADCGLPFVVITAGTRNHFALDLGLDRDDPAACLDALGDGVDLHVDLGTVGTRTFVNNASFGAYAEVVQCPAYRDDKLGSTLDVLPELLTGEQGASLDVRAGTVSLPSPQAVLVANNPYGTGDLAGLSRRARLDSGLLGVVGVSVASPAQAADLVRGARSQGVSILTAGQVVVDADEPEIPVGIDGEATLMPVPVHCSIRPAALTVRVPRHRPGVRPPQAQLDWGRLRQLAAPAPGRRRWRTEGAAGPRQVNPRDPVP
jgi:diacylglycerol kinase family enzyme